MHDIATGLSIVLAWCVALGPPLIIRYAVLKRQMDKWSAIGTCAFFWLMYVIVITPVFESRSKSSFAFGFALIAYVLLRKKTTAHEQARYSVSIHEASGDGTTPLMAAAMLGKIKKIHAAIADGANIDATDVNGWTPLMYAADRNEVEAVELLLKLGANFSLRSTENRTALEIAQGKESLEATAILQRYGAIANT